MHPWNAEQPVGATEFVFVYICELEGFWLQMITMNVEWWWKMYLSTLCANSDETFMMPVGKPGMS